MGTSLLAFCMESYISISYSILHGNFLFAHLYHLKFFKCPLRALIPYTCLQVNSFAAPSRSRTTNSNGCFKFYSVYNWARKK